MELNFTYDKKEWIRGYREYQFLVKRITKMQLVVMALLPFLIGAMICLNGMDGVMSLLIAISAVFYVMAGFVMLIQPHWIYKQTSKYHQPYKMMFSREGIYFEIKDISSKLGWDVYSEYSETKEFVYLLQGKVTYTLIPKRVFVTEKDLEQFRKILEESL